MLNLKKTSLVAIAFLTLGSTALTNSVDAKPPILEEIREEIKDRDRGDIRDEVRDRKGENNRRNRGRVVR